MFSEFCGKSVCKRCLVKKRAFPKDGSKYGESCIVCDRKFYIDELFAEFRNVLDNIKNEEEGMKATIKFAEKEYNAAEKELSTFIENRECKYSKTI